MQIAEQVDIATGIAVALLVTLGLIAGQVLVQRLFRAWIRRRIGFRATARSFEPCDPVDDACPEELQ